MVDYEGFLLEGVGFVVAFLFLFSGFFLFWVFEGVKLGFGW